MGVETIKPQRLMALSSLAPSSIETSCDDAHVLSRRTPLLQVWALPADPLQARAALLENIC